MSRQKQVDLAKKEIKNILGQKKKFKISNLDMHVLYSFKRCPYAMS